MTTTQQTVHTPTPWTQNSHAIEATDLDDPRMTLHIASVWDNGIPSPVATANAAFIVRACNAHEKIVDILQRTATILPLDSPLREEIREALLLVQNRETA